VLPARTPRPRQPLGSARASTCTPVHAALSIYHCRGLTGRAAAGLGSAPCSRARGLSDLAPPRPVEAEGFLGFVLQYKLSSDLSVVTLHRDVDLLRFEAVSANVGAVGNLEVEEQFRLGRCGQQVLPLLEQS
jgi:hypothetical protein